MRIVHSISIDCAGAMRNVWMLTHVAPVASFCEFFFRTAICIKIKLVTSVDN